MRVIIILLLTYITGCNIFQSSKPLIDENMAAIDYEQSSIKDIEAVSIDKNQIDTILETSKDVERKFNGVVKYISPDEKIFAVVKGGYLNGLTVVYKNDVLFSLCDYKKGLIHGLKQEYYPTGKIRSKAYYENGQIYDDYKEFYPNGEILLVLPYKNGKIEGVAKEYYENGRLKSEAIYINGYIDGFKREYDETGYLKYETPFVDNKITGIRKEYDKKKRLKSEKSYLSGVLDGISVEYDKEGNVEVEITYENGRIIKAVCGSGVELTEDEIRNFEQEALIKCRKPY